MEQDDGRLGTGVYAHPGSREHSAAGAIYPDVLLMTTIGNAHVAPALY